MTDTMTKKQLTEWAIKGLSAEIEKIEKDINKGQQFLLQYEQGQKPKTPKNPQEIKEIIRAKKAEANKLFDTISALRWEIELEE